MSTKRNAKRPNWVFGPPPLLEGEDAAAYDELLTFICNAVKPIDFIEEIWARDLTDLAWSFFRLRRIQAAFLTAKVSENTSKAADEEAASLAEAEAQLMQGAEKEEMDRLLHDNSLSWQELVSQNPQANQRFQKIWTSVKSNLDMDLIQAKVMIHEIDTIERIEHLITVTEQRFAAILREIDRHRVMVRHRGRHVHDFEEVSVKRPKIRKIIHKKVA